MKESFICLFIYLGNNNLFKILYVLGIKLGVEDKIGNKFYFVFFFKEFIEWWGRVL